MVERIKTGVDGLDVVIEGGFPRGSLILLAGEPGVGKTAFSMRFLAKGAELGEPGLYVGFAEAKDTLIENFSRHLGLDLAGLEAEGKLKILDYTAMREEAASTLLEAILDEVKALRAKRLVVDSFSAMAQAFERPMDVRIVAHAVLGRIVRGMDCTTLMIEEVPVGESKIGFGLEEFVADGVLRLRASELDGRLFRDLEIVKLRGTRISERKLAYTLEGGFKAYPPFRLKPIEKPKRFQPIPDKPDKYSTGVKDLDDMLEGGLPKGSITLLEISGKVSMLEYHLVLLPIMLNFGAQGRPVILIPTVGVDAELARRKALEYGATDDEINRLLRVCETPSPRKNQNKPYIAVFEGKDPWKDYEAYLKLEEMLVIETGQPALSVVGLDTLLAYYGERDCEKLLGQDAIRVRERNALGVGVLKPSYERLAEKLSGMATTHLRLTREHGYLLLYGVKPRTGLYAVEMDASKGYPLPKLTPIV